MNKLIKTRIPTADYGWNPVKGCSNTDCFLHPTNTGECWAAKMCNRMAGPWAKIESQYYPSFSVFKDDFGIVTRDDMEKAIKTKLKIFEPHFLKSQFQKKFPKKASMIAVGWMSDCSCWKPEWWRKTLDRIIADTLDRRSKGLKPHIFKFLTKFPEIYKEYNFHVNCWMGFTATTQKEYNDRWKNIANDFNHIIFAYLEPLTESISIKNRWLDWIIVGGQSGLKAKPLNPDWVRLIRDQCQAAGIPFFFKSWSKEYIPMGMLFDRQEQLIFTPKPREYKKIMKEKGTNWLDGKKWEQFPEIKNASNKPT